MAAELNNLAEVYRLDGRAPDAERFYPRALDMRERKSGSDHLNLAIVRSNLARLYADQARFADAEPLYRQALEAREKAVGPAHPALLPTLDSYAAVLRGLGRSAEADALAARAVQIRKRPATDRAEKLWDGCAPSKTKRCRVWSPRPTVPPHLKQVTPNKRRNIEKLDGRLIAAVSA